MLNWPGELAEEEPYCPWLQEPPSCPTSHLAAINKHCEARAAARSRLKMLEGIHPLGTKLKSGMKGTA